MKWPNLAAKSRRSTAEALTTITLALTGPRRKAPDPDLLRRALFGYAFNAASASRPVPAEIYDGLDWGARSMRDRTGRPASDRQSIRALVRGSARENPGWGTAGSTANWPDSA